MTESVAISMNKATASEIAVHLAQSDEDFRPRLSERVEMGDYAQKIVSRSERFEAWSGDTLVGLVAAYCNDTDAGTAYITSVSVTPSFRNQGLASRLLGECVEFVKRRRFKRISLEVDRENQPAVDLYAARGFAVMSVSGRTLRMELEMAKDVRMGSQP